MIYKRHLFTFGPADGTLSDDGEGDKKMLSMGEDEQWEALRKETPAPRTWWRKWLKIK